MITYDQQEIDLVEETEGRINAFELKWKQKKVKVPIAWKNAYPDTGFMVVRKEDFPAWVM